MLKKLFFIIILLSCFPLVALAQIKINNQKAEEGQTINLFYDDLDAGKIIFSIPADKLKKAEITLDQGRNWSEMKLEEESYIFAYRPLSDEVIAPEFLLTSEDGKMSTERPGVRVNYQRKKPDDAVEQVLEKMKMYYEQESLDRFMSMYSMSFPDRLFFQDSIQNDFFNYKNIRLFYRVDRRAFDSDLEGAIWDVYWERKFEDKAGADFSDSANISMRFDKESGTWLISGLRNNTIFGSSLGGGAVDLQVFPADIGFVNGVPFSGVVDITATVHNVGGGAGSNVKVNFEQSGFGPGGPWTLIGSTIIPSIPGGSSATSPSVNFAGSPAMIWDFRVVVDPDATIPETDETNNIAQTNHVLP